MKSFLFITTIAFIAMCAAWHPIYAQQNTINLTRYVNPFIGTGGHGHTFPGPTFPFGACQLSPDTRLSGWDGCSGYHYSDSLIYGFSHTHLSGTGCSDYGDILLMPTTKDLPLDNYQYASPFSHAKEKAAAGYYQVYLEKPNINAELTSTLHGGIHRYSFQENDKQYVVLDLKHRDEVLDSKMEKIDDYTIRGYRFSKAWAKEQKVFFEITFSKPIESIQYDAPQSASQTTPVRMDKSLHAILTFQNQTNPDDLVANPLQLLVKVSISGVDEEGAHNNLQIEMPHWDFNKYQRAAERRWEEELSKIQVNPFENGKMTDKNKLTIFYTALYHCMIHPSIYSDADGRYRGRDDKIHNTEGKFDYYTVFSLWDTYRALHPLLSILDPKRTNDFINTFIKQYEYGGRLPIWELSSNETNCMIGYHVVSVIWDAYHKGIRDYDVELAYEAMTKIATHYNDYEGEGLDMKLKESARKGAADADALESYCKFGYVRSDDSHESVSKTLEYAYNDWCIANMANALGKNEDYQYYFRRSQNWKNVYDPNTQFMRGKKNAAWIEPFTPYLVDNNYTEANSWQYSFYVPHAIPSMITIEKQGDFSKKLDALFAANEKTEGREQADITGLIGQYAHGNEPSHHIAYLYNHTFEFQKTKNNLKKITDDFYTNNPDGLIGNEDCGQMSAWYVFSALGFYPVCPGNNKYEMGTMLFDQIKINNGRERKDLSKSSIDQQLEENPNLEWNHGPYNFLNIGEKLQIASVDEAPHNNNLKKEFILNPYIQKGEKIFTNKQIIQLDCLEKGLEIWYAIDNESMKSYHKPIEIEASCTLTFFSKKGNSQSPMQVAHFTKLPTDRKIYLANTYSKTYSAGGADALKDGIYGKVNWRAGDWQGYQGQDIEVVMAFDQPREIKSMAANFLEDQNSWIFYPKEVLFYASNDSLHWTLIEQIVTHKSDHDETTSISKFETTIRNIKKQTYKYAKLKAIHFGSMPDWHEGRGNPTYIFIDEFEVQ
ncbi:MAG: GH92 family glycosyl hydrolase [Bacteroidetes bacterium]|nr:GH92 family glycosyl hydrolase [Bacteroidota bacterium]MBP6314087.1 GH92 family glycosyl hydrolase [Chitinophagaceae bacterium]